MGPNTEVRPYPPASPPAGWFDDPEWSGQKRYWDGTRWTDCRVPAPPVAPPVRPEPGPAAGWYDDPYGSSARRYWDGAQWTGQTLPVPPPAAPEPEPSAFVPTRPAEPVPVQAAADPAPPPVPAAVDPAPEPIEAAAPPPEPRAAAPEPEHHVPESAAPALAPPESESAAPETSLDVEPEHVEPEVSEAAVSPPAPPIAPPESQDTTPESPPPVEPESEPEVIEAAALPTAALPTETPRPETPTPDAGPDVGHEPTERRAPGWYDDPRAPGQERYWTGAVWSEDVRLPALALHSSPEAGATAPPIVAPSPPWYRRRTIWAVGAVAVLVVILVVALRSCGTQGATPQPGRFSGSGDGDFTIDFTVTTDGDVSDLGFNVSSDALDMSGTIDDTIEVDDGTFDVTLRDGLGLQTLTIEGRFTDGGRTATGSYDLGLAEGVEQQSGPEADASGSWQAELTDSD